MQNEWSKAVAGHRDHVRDTIGDRTWHLARARGPLNVTMSQAAAAAGISRATLYKYFPDVEAILADWHQRQVAQHLAQLQRARELATDPPQRLRAVLDEYARICRRRAEHGSGDLGNLLHRTAGLDAAHRQLTELVTEVLRESATEGLVRSDQPAEQLTAYCLHALAAAADVSSDANTEDLVDLVVAGLHPPAPSKPGKTARSRQVEVPK